MEQKKQPLERVEHLKQSHNDEGEVLPPPDEATTDEVQPEREVKFG